MLAALGNLYNFKLFGVRENEKKAVLPHFYTAQSVHMSASNAVFTKAK